jgi:hypothetical protein
VQRQADAGAWQLAEGIAQTSRKYRRRNCSCNFRRRKR